MEASTVFAGTLRGVVIVSGKFTTVSGSCGPTIVQPEEAWACAGESVNKNTEIMKTIFSASDRVSRTARFINLGALLIPIICKFMMFIPCTVRCYFSRRPLPVAQAINFPN
ncbi:hypothetical protein [Paraburkholderia sp. ZP32-5]|uniref:hypothetical protein n=1 Tax=Paraburkholderia sp. ZP32-5 TaxID=2883245 RepID=UPI001F3F61B1|nr:hypothetical protein [Paraburkholderia sp. ZP32-5]